MTLRRTGRRTERVAKASRARIERRGPLEILEELQGIETQILGGIDELAETVRGAVRQ